MEVILELNAKFHGISGYLGCICCENFNIYFSYFQINNFCADLQIIYYDYITNIFESISSCNLLNIQYFKMDSMLKSLE